MAEHRACVRACVRAIEMQRDEVQSGWAADTLPSPQTFSRLIQTSCIRLYHLTWEINSLYCPLKPNCVFLGLAGATSCCLKSGWSPPKPPRGCHTHGLRLSRLIEFFWGRGERLPFDIPLFPCDTGFFFYDYYKMYFNQEKAQNEP